MAPNTAGTRNLWEACGTVECRLLQHLDLLNKKPVVVLSHHTYRGVGWCILDLRRVVDPHVPYARQIGRDRQCLGLLRPGRHAGIQAGHCTRWLQCLFETESEAQVQRNERLIFSRGGDQIRQGAWGGSEMVQLVTQSARNQTCLDQSPLLARFFAVKLVLCYP